ncbi:MAG: helix-turn-helix domain-containing protein [Stenomitos rutilans HA7619-LM2]|nr:helix-turn-helix domain-containing protein [Stenomitos rutilans HA7619-LM2]
MFCPLLKLSQAGLQAARVRGRKGGRRPKLTPHQIEIGRSLAADPKRSVPSICKHLGISRPTYYRYINLQQESELAGIKRTG